MPGGSSEAWQHVKPIFQVCHVAYLQDLCTTYYGLRTTKAHDTMKYSVWMVVFVRVVFCSRVFEFERMPASKLSMMHTYTDICTL